MEMVFKLQLQHVLLIRRLHRQIPSRTEEETVWVCQVHTCVPGGARCWRHRWEGVPAAGRRGQGRSSLAGTGLFTRDWKVHGELELCPGGGHGTHSSVLAWRVPWAGSLAGCSPRGHEEPDAAEPLHSALSSVLLLFPGKQQGPTFEGGCQCFQILYCVAQKSKKLPAVWETWIRPLSRADPLERERAAHSSILGLPWQLSW